MLYSIHILSLVLLSSLSFSFFVLTICCLSSFYLFLLPYFCPFFTLLSFYSISCSLFRPHFHYHLIQNSCLSLSCLSALPYSFSHSIFFINVDSTTVSYYFVFLVFNICQCFCGFHSRALSSTTSLNPIHTVPSLPCLDPWLLFFKHGMRGILSSPPVLLS